MFLQVLAQLTEGFYNTLLIFGVTLLVSLPLGLIVAFGSMSKILPIKVITRLFVWIIRGTPLMLQVISVFYLPGLLFYYPMRSRMTAVLVAFIINYAAYFSEIYRGGIESIPRGQYEAGKVLGLTKWQIFYHVILIQVIKRILAPISNEVITLVKDTSLARVIAITEIIMAAEIAVSRYAIVWPLFFTGVFYLLFSGLLTILFDKLEKRFDYIKV
ncbi:MAG: amino acid ABC transporter permease [Clostridiales bacterium]|nr:amino acid ABC transporter permease [Clostridiales bacterium]